MLPETQTQTFRSFYSSARLNDILDPKTTLLIHLAVSMMIGCYPCITHYLSVAKEENLTEQEIGAAQAIVMAVAAGSIDARFKDALGLEFSTTPDSSCCENKV